MSEQQEPDFFTQHALYQALCEWESQRSALYGINLSESQLLSEASIDRVNLGLLARMLTCYLEETGIVCRKRDDLPWYEPDEIGDQARNAGKLLAVRCRHCGHRHEYPPDVPCVDICPGCGKS